MGSNKNNRSKVTRILGGYGRTGRVLRTTFPSKIAQALSIRRGDRIRWQVAAPGYQLSNYAIIVTFAEHSGAAPAIRRTTNFLPQSRKQPQSIQKKYIDPYDALEEEFYLELLGLG